MEHSTLSSASGSASKNMLAKWLGHIITGCIGGLVFLMPLWFLSQTLDILELNKQTLLIFLALIGTVAWLGKAMVERQVTLTRSWLHLVVVLFGAGYLATSLFSSDRYLSLVGNFGQMQWAFVTIVAFVLVYLLLVNTVKTTAALYHLVLVFLGSSTLAGLFGLLQMSGWQVFAKWIPATLDMNFNTVGSVNSLAMFMTVPLVLAVSLTVLGCKDKTCVLGKKGHGSIAANCLVWVSMIVGLAVVTVADFWAAWASILFGMAVVLVATALRRRKIGNAVQTIVPGIVAAIAVALLIWPTPIKIALPAEVAPSMEHSWQIGQAALQDHPLFGSGPGTWIYDYAKYRVPLVNLSQFWTYRFERGISSFFTLMATLGIVGMSLWFILLLSGMVKSVSQLATERDDDRWQAYLTVYAGWVTVVFVSFVYNYNVAHHFVFWLLLGLLGSLVATGKFTWNAKDSSASMGVLSAAFIILGVAAVSGAWVSVQRLVADVKYSSSVMSFRSGRPVEEAIASLEKATALNKFNDVYYRNLSQAYLLKASQIMKSAPDETKSKLVATTIAMAVDAAKHAADLSPANVDNWSNLAVIYQNIAGFTPGADEYAIKNYQEGLKREPNNPSFYNELGKLYILRADAYRTVLASTDEKAKKDAEAHVKVELDKAADQLNQAIAIKGDYAEAYYNLGILYERQGKIKEAVKKLEQVLANSPKDVGVGFQLGILYYRDGQKDKAINMFEQIVSLDPTYVNARWYLSAMYEERGRLDDAIAQVQLVLKAQKSDVVAKRLQALIEARDKKNAPVVVPLPEPLPETIKGPAPLNEVKKP